MPSAARRCIGSCERWTVTSGWSGRQNASASSSASPPGARCRCGRWCQSEWYTTLPNAPHESKNACLAPRRRAATVVHAWKLEGVSDDDDRRALFLGSSSVGADAGQEGVEGGLERGRLSGLEKREEVADVDRVGGLGARGQAVLLWHEGQGVEPEERRGGGACAAEGDHVARAGDERDGRRGQRGVEARREGEERVEVALRRERDEDDVHAYGAGHGDHFLWDWPESKRCSTLSYTDYNTNTGNPRYAR